MPKGKKRIAENNIHHQSKCTSKARKKIATDTASRAAAKSSDTSGAFIHEGEVYYHATRIIQESKNGKEYLVEWEGTDPKTKKPYEPTWTPTKWVSEPLLKDWKQRKSNPTDNPSINEKSGKRKAAAAPRKRLVPRSRKASAQKIVRNSSKAKESTKPLSRSSQSPLSSVSASDRQEPSNLTTVSKLPETSSDSQSTSISTAQGHSSDRAEIPAIVITGSPENSDSLLTQIPSSISHLGTKSSNSSISDFHKRIEPSAENNSNTYTKPAAEPASSDSSAENNSNTYTKPAAEPASSDSSAENNSNTYTKPAAEPASSDSSAENNSDIHTKPAAESVSTVLSAENNSNTHTKQAAEPASTDLSAVITDPTSELENNQSIDTQSLWTSDAQQTAKSSTKSSTDSEITATRRSVRAKKSSARALSEQPLPKKRVITSATSDSNQNLWQPVKKRAKTNSQQSKPHSTAQTLQLKEAEATDVPKSISTEPVPLNDEKDSSQKHLGKLRPKVVPKSRKTLAIAKNKTTNQSLSEQNKPHTIISQNSSGSESMETEISQTETTRPLSPRQRVIHMAIPLSVIQLSLYNDKLTVERDLLLSFLDTPAVNEDPQQKEAVQGIVDAAYSILSHPDLDNTDTTAAKAPESSSAPTSEPERDSSKFEFVTQLASSLGQKRLSVFLFSRPGGLMDMLEAHLEALNITFLRPDTNRLFNAVSENRLGPRVVLLPTGQAGTVNFLFESSEPPDIIIGFDETFRTSDPHVSRLIHRSDCPVIHLVVAYAIDHIGGALGSRSPSRIGNLREIIAQSLNHLELAGTTSVAPHDPKTLAEFVADAISVSSPTAWKKLPKISMDPIPFERALLMIGSKHVSKKRRHDEEHIPRSSPYQPGVEASVNIQDSQSISNEGQKAMLDSISNMEDLAPTKGTEISGLKSENLFLKDEIKRLTIGGYHWETDYSALTTRYQEKEIEAIRYNMQLEKAFKDLNATKAELEAAKTKHAEEALALQDEIRALKQKRGSDHEAVISSTSSATDESKVIEELKKQVENVQKKLADQRSIAEYTATRYRDTTTQLRVKELEGEELGKRLKTLSDTAIAKEGELQVMFQNESYRRSERGIREMRARIDHLQQHNHHLMSTLRKEKALNAQHRNSVASNTRANSVTPAPVTTETTRAVPQGQQRRVARERAARGTAGPSSLRHMENSSMEEPQSPVEPDSRNGSRAGSRAGSRVSSRASSRAVSPLLTQAPATTAEPTVPSKKRSKQTPT